MTDIFKYLTKEKVNAKLLQYGLFAEKLGPIFQSQTFGRWAKKTKLRLYFKESFSCVSYRLTRNNNAPRIIEIPHPIAYYRLCEEIRSSWKEIIGKIGEIDDYADTSMVIPKPNNLNKRLVSMKSYNKRDDEKFLILDKSLGKKYFVHIDIANCYPSIYSHSIPWALVGVQEAKKNMRDSAKWYNKLDFAIRSMQRNETIGLPIGPDTSSLISELLLSRVDKELERFDYMRFIDDYRCYCKSKEEAEEFILKTSRELEKYHLRLNPKKTRVIQLPLPLNEDWVRALRQCAAKFLNKKKYSQKDINILSEFIDLSIKLSKDNPDDSPIRYAVKILSNKEYIDNKALGYIIMYLSRICFIYPYFIDVFDELLEKNKEHITDEVLKILETEMNILTKEHVKYSRSDVSLWGVYLAIKYNFELLDFEDYSNQLMDSRDCLPTLMCYLYAEKQGLKFTNKYFSFIASLILEQIEDEWWIFIYELYWKKPSKPVFKKIRYKDYYEEMRKENITFMA